MSKNGLKKVIVKFEETENLYALPRKEWKAVANETAKEVATVVFERTSSFS